MLDRKARVLHEGEQVLAIRKMHSTDSGKRAGQTRPRMAVERRPKLRSGMICRKPIQADELPPRPQYVSNQCQGAAYARRGVVRHG